MSEITTPMSAAERQKLIRAITGADVDQRGDAAYGLAASRDRGDVEALLGVLKTSSDRHVQQLVIEALVENAPTTLESVLICLTDDPPSQAGQNCAYIVGEIAFRQGAQRDPRIVPALIEAIRAALPAGTWAVSSAVAALRECARTGPIPEANDLLLQVIAAAGHEPEPYVFAVRNSAEILLINNGDTMRHRLRESLEDMSPDNPAAEVLAQLVAD
jgi:hypothetical protein